MHACVMTYVKYTSPATDISQLLCQYNYTIGTTLPVIITQSDPVCLICSNMSSSMWTINQIVMQTIAPAPYILYVPSPATTFLGGPTVACYPVGTPISSTGEWTIDVFYF